jgi:hypothetical protein
VADADENGSIDKPELFLFIRNYEKFRSDREGLVALVKNYTEKIGTSGRLNLARQSLPKLIKVAYFNLVSRY